MSDAYYLQLYTRYLSGSLTADRPEINYSQKLAKLFSLLQQNGYKCSVSVSHSAILCLNCRDSCMPGLQLPCGHFLCSISCLRSLIENCTKGVLSDYECVLCPKCGMQIPRNIIIYVIGGEEEFRLRISEESKKTEPEKTCDICIEDKRMSDLVTLTCDHRYCRDCISTYLLTKIRDGEVAEDILVCPQDQIPIDHNIIKAHLHPIEYEKFERFRLRQWTPKDLDAVQFKCKGTDCEYMELVRNDLKEFTCPSCGTKACPRCNEEPHPNITCEVMKAWKQKHENIDQDLAEFMKKENVYRCPWCSTAIEKNGGCKYMTCKSEICKGKKYFCVDCMTKLNKPHERHQCHTPDLPWRRCSIF